MKFFKNCFVNLHDIKIFFQILLLSEQGADVHKTRKHGDEVSPLQLAVKNENEPLNNSFEQDHRERNTYSYCSLL